MDLFLVGGAISILKNINQWDIPYMKWKIKAMFETTDQIWRFPKMGVPNSWMVYFMDNPDLTWMIDGVPLF